MSIGVGTGMFLINPFLYKPGTSYLLDTYSAAAAYSLRQLKTGVTNVVRVRRSSDNAESDFSASDITDGTLTTWTGANNGFVVTWYDQSGNATDYNLRQTTAANQAKIVSSGSLIAFGSGYGVEFDGSTDGYSTINVVSELSSAEWSYSAVHKADTNTTYNAIFNTASGSSGVGGDDRILAACGVNSSPLLTIVKNTSNVVYSVSASPALSTGTEYLSFSAADSSKNFETWINGTTQGSDTWTGVYNNTGLWVGYHTAFSQYMDGVIGELIIWGTDESANRTAIETDINGHYSIY